MITQFAGRCFLCKKSVEAGIDVYYNKPQGVAHWECYENQPPGPEAYALADQLGFVPHDDARIRAAVADWRVRADWLLRRLSNADRGNSAGRPRAATPARREPDLFDEEEIA